MGTYYRIDASRLDAPYRLDECQQCGLIFQRFVGNDALMCEIYSEWAPTPDTAAEVDTFIQNIAAPEHSRDGHELMTVAAYLGKPISELRVLDYGMGWGLWPAIAKKLGADAYGTELSPKMAENAKNYGVKVVSEPTGPFDFINLEQVIEHVPKPRHLLDRLSGTLAPGGIVKLSLPNASNARSIIRQIKAGRYRGDYPTIIPIQPLEHVNSFTHGAVKALADDAGFRIVTPKIRERYAFVRAAGLPRNPKAAVKELVRPFWQYHNRRNLYVWLRRP